MSEPWKVFDPWSGSLLREVAAHNADDVEAALERAQAASTEMAQASRYRRSLWCQTIAGRIERRREEFVRLIVSEAGKPISYAEGEVARALTTFRLAAHEALRDHGETVPVDIEANSEGYLAYTRRAPLGPVAAITPFNFPLNLVAHKVAPALAVGNPVLLKPAPETPLSALLLAEVIQEVIASKGSAGDLPEGAFTCLLLEIPETERLLADERIRFVSFTGSAQVGWQIKAAHPKKKVALELGGNAAAVVCADADLDWAVPRLAGGGYAYAGQVCIAVQRLLVDNDIYEEFKSRYLAAVGALGVGDPALRETVVGPLIRGRELERLQQWVDQAVDAGATVLLGGRPQGPCYLPTVLENVSPSSKVSCEEVFGPITLLEPFESFREAMIRVNDSRYGLQAGIFTSNLERALTAHRTAEVGAVIINDYPTFRVDSMPYGGVKDSGFGREGVRYTMEEMTEPRLLVIRSQV